MIATSRKFEFERTGSTTAYLRFAAHPGSLKGGRNIPLSDLIGKHGGPYVVFDLDAGNNLAGIEIIVEDDEEEEGEDVGCESTIDEAEPRIRLQVSAADPEVAYLKLSECPNGEAPKVVRTLNLRKLIGDYGGADLDLDFDETGTLIGVKILV